MYLGLGPLRKREALLHTRAQRGKANAEVLQFGATIALNRFAAQRVSDRPRRGNDFLVVCGVFVHAHVDFLLDAQAAA